MQFDPRYQDRYMVYPMNPREQDGYAMNGYAPPPPGMCYTCSVAVTLPLHTIIDWSSRPIRVINPSSADDVGSL